MFKKSCISQLSPVEKLLKILKKEPTRSNYYPEENEKKKYFEILRHNREAVSRNLGTPQGLATMVTKIVKLCLYDSQEMQIQFMGIPAESHSCYGVK